MDIGHVRFYHLQVGSGQVTVACRGTIIGLAWCSPEDQFCKRTGRIKAEARLDSKVRWVGEEIISTDDAIWFIDELLNKARHWGEFDNWHVPRWVGYQCRTTRRVKRDATQS